MTRPAAGVLSEAAGPAFAPNPARGRVFTALRTVRSTDVTPDGRLRFDALARYLQDAAEDDVADAGLREPYDWVLRRVAIAIRGYPARGEPLELTTFCSATGPRWAERTTTVSAGGADLMQARAVWAAFAGDSGQPLPLGPEFHRRYGESAEGRTVSVRLSHPGPPAPDGSHGPDGPDGSDGAQPGRTWPLRASDFDMAGHVNNSVHWAAVEDVLAKPGWLPASAELEYHRPILAGHAPRLVVSRQPDLLWCWLLDGGRRLASARLARAEGAAR
jgi:acyl-ACP thioesterase